MASYPSWPASLPQTPRRGAWTGGAQEARAIFLPEVGPPIMRRRTTADTYLFDASFPNLSTAQRAAFERFWIDDLRGGSLPFVMRDPVTQAASRWMISGGGAAPFTLTAKGAGWHDLSMRLVRLPGATWFADYLPTGSLLVPDLVLDFASQIYGAGGVRKTFSDLVTFARAGSASYVDANGVTQSAGTDAPRFDHDPSTHAPLGLLLDDTDGDSAAIGASKWPEGLFASAGTVLFVCRSNQVSGAGYNNAFAVTGAATSDRVDFIIRSAASAFRVIDDGVAGASLDFGAYSVGTRIAMAGAFTANDARVCRDGGSILADTSLTVPTLDRATFGVGQDRIWIEKVVCWNRSLDNATLQGLSA